MLISLATVFIVATVIFSSFSHGPDQIYILSDEYRGPVFVLFNQPKGRPVIVQDNALIFEIPSDGLVKISNGMNTDWHRLWKFYSRRGDEWVELTYTTETDQRSNNSIQVCCFSTGKSYSNDTGTAVEFVQFIVGTKSDIETSLKKMEKVHVADFAEN